jgi:hypothetical protein
VEFKAECVDGDNIISDAWNTEHANETLKKFHIAMYNLGVLEVRDYNLGVYDVKCYSFATHPNHKLRYDYLFGKITETDFHEALSRKSKKSDFCSEIIGVVKTFVRIGSNLIRKSAKPFKISRLVDYLNDQCASVAKSYGVKTYPMLQHEMLGIYEEDMFDPDDRVMSEHELQTLQAENGVLTRNKICRKCLFNDANICTLPCCHVSQCSSCLDRDNIMCHDCDVKPSSFVRVYWP